ncbi:hypothetical protein LXL04_022557 [Taraxacum kok-saghyz]
MTKSIDKKTRSQNAVPSISIKIKNPNSYRRKEEDVKPSRVHETLKAGKVNVYKNKFSLDRKLNDQSVSNHEVASSTANRVGTRKPPKSKKLTIKLQNQPKIRDYQKRKVADLTSSLSGRNVIDKKRGGLSLKVKENVQENDEDVIKAAETLMMMSRGLQPPMAESIGNKRCLGLQFHFPFYTYLDQQGMKLKMKSILKTLLD